MLVAYMICNYSVKFPQASFLGRSGVGVSNSSRPNSQQNTKSYIFGRDDSNSAHEASSLAFIQSAK